MVSPRLPGVSAGHGASSGLSEGKGRQRTRAFLEGGWGGEGAGQVPELEPLRIQPGHGFFRHEVVFLVLGPAKLEALGREPGQPVPSASHRQPGRARGEVREARGGPVPLPRPPPARAAAWGFSASGPTSQLRGHAAPAPGLALSWKIPRSPAAVTREAGNGDTQGTQGVGLILRAWLGGRGSEGGGGRARQEAREESGEGSLGVSRPLPFPRAVPASGPECLLVWRCHDASWGTPTDEV